jgi:hypothetical protein
MGIYMDDVKVVKNVKFKELKPIDCDDYYKYTLMPYWKYAEAILLSMDIDAFYGKKIDNDDEAVVKYASEYNFRCTLLDRALEINVFDDIGQAHLDRPWLIKFSPIEFTNWAMENFPSFPPKLYEAVMKRYSTYGSEDRLKSFDKTEQLISSVQSASSEEEPNCYGRVLDENWPLDGNQAQDADNPDSEKECEAGSIKTSELENLEGNQNGNAGAVTRWKKRDELANQAETFMKQLLEMNCLCSHEKLAKITYEMAENRDGVPFVDCDQKNFGLYGEIKRRAKLLVPEERHFGDNKNYNSEACKCEIADHQNFKLTRHRE